MVKVKLNNGQIIENLTVNGTNFVSQEQIDESLFTRENLATITVIENEKETVYENMEFILQVKYKDGWYFCFRQLSESEITITDLQLALAELYESMVG